MTYRTDKVFTACFKNFIWDQDKKNLQKQISITVYYWCSLKTMHTYYLLGLELICILYLALFCRSLCTVVDETDV